MIHSVLVATLEENLALNVYLDDASRAVYAHLEAQAKSVRGIAHLPDMSLRVPAGRVEVVNTHAFPKLTQSVLHERYGFVYMREPLAHPPLKFSGPVHVEINDIGQFRWVILDREQTLAVLISVYVASHAFTGRATSADIESDSNTPDWDGEDNGMHLNGERY